MADEFHARQRRVVLAMALAVVVTGLVLAAAALWPGTSLDLDARLDLVVRADLVLALWLALAIGDVARLRLLSPEAIDGGEPPGSAVERAQAILRNTLEQAALAIPVHLALAVRTPDATPLILALIGLFSLGRLLFWIGYGKGAEARALGFGLTFYPTLAAAVMAALA